MFKSLVVTDPVSNLEVQSLLTDRLKIELRGKRGRSSTRACATEQMGHDVSHFLGPKAGWGSQVTGKKVLPVVEFNPIRFSSFGTRPYGAFSFGGWSIWKFLQRARSLFWQTGCWSDELPESCIHDMFRWCWTGIKTNKKRYWQYLGASGSIWQFFKGQKFRLPASTERCGVQWRYYREALRTCYFEFTSMFDQLPGCSLTLIAMDPKGCYTIYYDQPVLGRHLMIRMGGFLNVHFSDATICIIWGCWSFSHGFGQRFNRHTPRLRNVTQRNAQVPWHLQGGGNSAEQSLDPAVRQGSHLPLVMTNIAMENPL
jgi:hypothetical protein